MYGLYGRGWVYDDVLMYEDGCVGWIVGLYGLMYG